MAIQTLSFISLILRPYVEQPISTDGWKHLFAKVERPDGADIQFTYEALHQACPHTLF